MKWPIAILFAIFAGPCYGQTDEIALPEGITLNSTIDYYDVSAPSFAKLGKRLKSAAPVRDDGKVTVSDTTSSWKVGIETITEPGLCTTEDVVMTLNTITSAPRWIEFESAPYEEQKAWKAFEAGLQAHADGHISIDVQTITAIREALLSVQPGTSCAILKTEMSMRAQEVEARFSKAHKKYDRETKDGRKQGAVLKKQL